MKGFSYVRISTGFSVSRSGKRSKKLVILVAVVSVSVITLTAIAAIALFLSLAPRQREHQHVPFSCQLSTYQRFDCLPGVEDPKRETCSTLPGCCWNDSAKPYCYHSSESGYSVEQAFQHTAVGISGCLARKQLQSSIFGQNLPRLCVNITFETEDRLHVKVSQHSN